MILELNTECWTQLPCQASLVISKSVYRMCPYAWQCQRTWK